MSRSPYKTLFSEFSLGHLTLKNRVISTSHAPAYADNGMPGERYQLYHEEKAKGGLAMTMFGGASSVSADSPASFGQLNVSNDTIVPFFRSFADRIHAHDAALMCQLSHAGRRTRPSTGNWLPTVAPSAVREPAHGAMPKVLDNTDIKRIVSDYASAAMRCYQGGLDGVELLASGHLIGQFWSPLSNKRSDSYGGSFDNRMRFGLEVLEAIRAAIPDKFIVSLRFTANEFVEGGIDSEQGIAIAQRYANSGLIDCLNVSGGANWTKAGVAETVPSMAFASGRFIELAGQVRAATGLPILHAAGVADFSTANYAVENGHVDLIGMTRAHIADPHLVKKHLAGEDDAIRPCVGAGFCIDRIYHGGDSLCLHNAVTGREQTLSYALPMAQNKQVVVVVGAGPAGLELARVLAIRGHKVIVLEAQNEAGGQIAYIARVQWRADMIAISRWLYDQCCALGVEFHFNQLAEIEDILRYKPSVVVLATGGMPQMDGIEGVQQFANSVWDVMAGGPQTAKEAAIDAGTQTGQRVLVYDETGSQSGPGCAEFLANSGSSVTLVTPDRMIAQDVGVTNHAIHLRNLSEAGVKIHSDLRLVLVEKSGNQLAAQFRHEYSNLDSVDHFDQVVVEAGTEADETLFQELLSKSTNQGHVSVDAFTLAAEQPLGPVGVDGQFALFRIGDCVSARGIHAAMLDAQRLGRGI